jgi:hypothetical protein
MFSLLEPRAKVSIRPMNWRTMRDFQWFFLGPQRKSIKSMSTGGTVVVVNNNSSNKNNTIDLTVSALDVELRTEICELYLVDVYLMRHLGIPTPHCSGLLPPTD